MYPILFRIGHLTIPTYGVVVALAGLAAAWLAGRSFTLHGLRREDAWDIAVYALLFGFLGAKIYYALLTGDAGMLVSKGGFVWYGGLIAGTITTLLLMRRRGIPWLQGADAMAPAVALGHGIGHIACFFSGDSYGLPSSLPWAVAFPHGAPPSTAGNLRTFFGVDVPGGIPDATLLRVHPTMLYSAAVLLLLALLLYRLAKRPHPRGWLIGLYLLLAGTERVLVEFLRAKDDRLLGGLTLAQGIAGVLILAGIVFLVFALSEKGMQHFRPAPAAGGESDSTGA